ncbi:hypothetical protein [Sinosporangium siamense]|uniref:hypothetical protein n=1 Tax=Sinosporangium siamense TaxID=1367973 RepID=UPI00194FB990|nr:hypothetical protein [Sinosporangium siamense]
MTKTDLEIIKRSPATRGPKPARTPTRGLPGRGAKGTPRRVEHDLSSSDGVIKPTTAEERPARARSKRVPRAPRAPFVLLVVGLLCGGLVSLLLLNMVLAQDSIAADSLRTQTNDILRKAQEVKQDNMRREQPANMAAEAERLGERTAWKSPDFVDPDRPDNLTGRSVDTRERSSAASGTEGGTPGGTGPTNAIPNGTTPNGTGQSTGSPAGSPDTGEANTGAPGAAGGPRTVDAGTAGRPAEGPAAERQADPVR